MINMYASDAGRPFFQILKVNVALSQKVSPTLR